MKKINFCNDWTITSILERHGDPQNEICKQITLPHDASVLTHRNPASKGASHSGRWDGGQYRYTKVFHVPADLAEKVLMLEFEGVYMNAMVYINDNFAGKCPNGYMNFYIPLNDLLHFGADNKIDVYVKTGAMPNSRWYTGSGIYRPVYLYIADQLHIPENGIRFTTEYVRNNTATVSVATTLRNAGFKTRNATLITRVLDSDGKEIACRNLSVHCFSGKDITVRQRMILDNVQLWEETNPVLYTIDSHLQEDGKDIDETSVITGIRTLTLNACNGLCVNGKSVKLRGACIHHTSGFIGAATFACEEERKIRMLQQAGFNAIRISHQPCSKDMLAACDRLGMYVMEESFDQWNWTKVHYDYALSYNEWWERDVESFVNKDYNHPSVILYSIGNEIRECATIEGAAQAFKIAEKIRSLDNTRYITNAVNAFLCCLDGFDRFIDQTEIKTGGEINSTMNIMTNTSVALHPEFTASFEESTHALDIIGYNYLERRYDIDCTAHPDRIYMGSETFPKDIGYNWDRVRKYPNLIGDFTWTGMEYLGEAGIARHEYDTESSFYGPYPYFYSGSGDITLSGYRLPISYYREIAFGLRKAPYISVWLPEHYGKKHVTSVWGWSDSIHNWRWSGFEGKPVQVEVYSNADEVELQLNGVSIGKKPVENYIAVFDLTYAPGKLVAISYNNGIETGRDELCTADDSLALHVDVDCTEINAGAQDLAHILITLTDKSGRPRIDADRKVRLIVEGAGTLMGFGSDNPTSTEEFFENEHTLYRGRALAFIRSGLESGCIAIRVCCDGFADQIVHINVK